MWRQTQGPQLKVRSIKTASLLSQVNGNICAYLPLLASTKGWIWKRSKIQADGRISARTDRGGAGIGHKTVLRLDAHLIKTPAEQSTNCYCSLDEEWCPTLQREETYQCRRPQGGCVVLRDNAKELFIKLHHKILLEHKHKRLKLEYYETSQENLQVHCGPGHNLHIAAYLET